MRMILGLDAPTQGSVTVGGRSYRDPPAPMREVGALLDARRCMAADGPATTCYDWPRVTASPAAGTQRGVCADPDGGCISRRGG
jgi:hypothetical protein